MNYFLELIVCQELARQDNWPHCKELLCTTRQRNINLLCLPDGILFGSCTGTTILSTNHCHHCHGLMGVSLLENKAELQLVEIAILIGQFQSDRAF